LRCRGLTVAQIFELFETLLIHARLFVRFRAALLKRTQAFEAFLLLRAALTLLGLILTFALNFTAILIRSRIRRRLREGR